MARRMLGFDIGNYGMKIAVVNGDRVERCESVTVPDNMVVNGQIMAFSAAGDFIREVLREKGIHVRRCAVALPEKNYYIRRVRLPKMTIAQLMVNLPYEFHDYVTGEASEYVYDYSVLGMGERSMELTICAISKQRVSQYIDMMHRAGLKLVKLVPDVLAIQSILNEKPLPIRELDDIVPSAPVNIAPERKSDFGSGIDSSLFVGSDKTDESEDYQDYSAYASYANPEPVDPENFREDDAVNSFEFTPVPEELPVISNSANPAKTAEESPADRDYAVLDLGHGGTRIHFFSGGAYEITRTLMSGAHDLLNMVVTERGVDPHIARLLLEKNQDHILQSRSVQDELDAIATEVMRTMNFYNYNNPKNTIDCLYYFGDGLDIEELYGRIHEMTGLPVKPLTELIKDSILIPDLIKGPQAFGAVIE